VQLNNPSFILDNLDLITGDCIESMKKMPDQCVNTCVTSPPYFGLRDYGMEGQIGLEDTPDAFVTRLVEVFREVKRVLRDDGTLWLNLGDSYAGSGRGPAGNLGKKHNERHLEGKHSCLIPDGLKPKDLIGIPWRVAFALQADGWYLRQDIIWHKPNPMPESVRDRCTKAHEYIFLMSKSPKYYYDHEAIKEEAKTPDAVHLTQKT
jgi:DNA modification methylase